MSPFAINSIGVRKYTRFSSTPPYIRYPKVPTTITSAAISIGRRDERRDVATGVGSIDVLMTDYLSEMCDASIRRLRLISRIA